MWSVGHPPLRRIMGGLVVGMVVILAGCGGSSVAAHMLVPNQSLPVVRGLSHPLTFYEGPDETEPFTPFMVTRATDGKILAFGYADEEGASYIASYNEANWQEYGVTNGFVPSDPQWDCDDSPERGTYISPDATLMARTCIDGSTTVYAIPNGIAVYHIANTLQMLAVGARTPVVAFASSSHLMALTTDGPAGPGQAITLYDTQTWQVKGTLTISAGLLTKPAWSPDDTRLAAVDLNGVLHIWDAQTLNERASAAIDGFSLGMADSDPAGPAPQWSADGTLLYTATPTKTGTTLTAWTTASLTAQASAMLAAQPIVAMPQLAPDGQHLFVQTTFDHGQIFTAPDLKQVSDFPLPGAIVQWGSDSKHLNVFTSHATVVGMTVG